MDDFLVKPVDPPKLVRMLRHCVERRRRRPLPVAPADAPAKPAQA